MVYIITSLRKSLMLVNGGYLILTGEDINRIMREQSKNAIKIAIDELIRIYKDDWDCIIESELRRQFTEKTRKKLSWLKTKEFNLVKRVVKETSLVYKKPAKRECYIPVESDGKITMRPIPEYIKLREESKNLDTKMKQVNRYTNLNNHVLLKVVYREGKIDYDILLFNNVEIFTDPDDWMKIKAIKYYTGLNLPAVYEEDGNESSATVKFNDKQVARNRHDIPIASYNRSYLYCLEDAEEDNDAGQTRYYKKCMIYTYEQLGDGETLVDVQESPYADEEGNAILPFVLFSKSEPVDTLLNFTEGNDLVDANLNIAINMIHLNNLIKFQAYKQTYMKVADVKSVPANAEMDPQTMMVIESKDGVGEIGVLDLQANIGEFWRVIKERALNILAQYNISPENFSLSASPQSGFSLMISNMAKLEAREDQIPIYREREEELNYIERIIYNYHNPSGKIPVDAKFRIDFTEITFPQSPEERMTEFTFYRSNNVKTPVDLIIEQNPDLNADEAKKKFFDNKAINQEMNVTLQPIQQPGNTETEGEE